MMTTISCKCPFCGKSYTVEVPTDEYLRGLERYHNGELLQNAFPTFSPSVREALKTGICDDCWNSF